MLSSREVWHAVLLTLPNTAAPDIVPFHSSEDADFKALAVKATRGFHNWTSGLPKPTRRTRFYLPESWRRLERIFLVPGGRYFFYFEEKSFECFDIGWNNVITKHKLEGARLLGYGLEVGEGGQFMRLSLTELCVDE